MPIDETEIPFFNDDEPLRSEPRGFDPDQMVTCDVCLRANPPTRTSCLYCAALLPVTELSAELLKPTLRELENWESGFNVIYHPDKTARLADTSLESLADLLRLEVTDLKLIVDSEQPMPLARAPSRMDASLIESRLSGLGVSAIVVADTELPGNDTLARRVRAVEFTDTELITRTSGGGGEVWPVRWDALRLMVAGRFFTRQVEIEERKTRKSEGDIVDARELSTDEPVLDIYSDESGLASRISAANFDYSCLGARKGLIAGENFSTLIAILRERATQARFDDSYSRVRRALSPVWPLEQHTEGRGWRRRRPGLVSTEAVTTSTNEVQFTRYSRFRNYLRLHNPEWIK